MTLPFSLADWYEREGLLALDQHFLEYLHATDALLADSLGVARLHPEMLEPKAESELMLALGPHVEDFIVARLGIEADRNALADLHLRLGPLYRCKRLFVQRRVAKAQLAMDGWQPDEAARPQGDIVEWELRFSEQVLGWLDKPEHSAELESAAHYAAWALFSEAGKTTHAGGLLFKLPKKIDLEHLVEVRRCTQNTMEILATNPEHLRARDGFKLTDDGGSLAKALDEAHYCIFCAHQGRDSCSKGMKEKEGKFKINAQNVTLTGCPLEEHISEMNELKANGCPIGALAAVTVTNPMCAGTGHRICNDCMKACIYQKQEPVNIPQVETRVLNDVLQLPYGFEIYSLLTRWNPLNFARPAPRAPTGKKVLVAGLGPAGYTLAHHLLQDGHSVVGIDGLKIEPLPAEICGVDTDGSRQEFRAVQTVHTLYESLDKRAGYGFGGVAEYGITVRWNKNYLKLIRLLLERRRQFRMFGGIRFGSTLTYESSFELGFDHIALCMGAGKPTLLEIPNGMARGVRTASDFLMALQLTGAAREESIANLQLRLPVVVIGGGLTAIDTATEALAYYPVQVEKFLRRYEILAAKQGENAIRQGWSREETAIAEEFITHAKALRAEKQKPVPDILGLLKSWGGVTIAYRKRLQDAPSYRLNHEEVEKAFEEGIGFAENLTPERIEVDDYGHVQALSIHGGQLIPARTVLIAAGTQPNTALSREDALHFQLDGKYFRAVDEHGTTVTPEQVAKPDAVRVLMNVRTDGRAVSFFGDLHPSFAGNVVKAMASAKQGYLAVSAALARVKPSNMTKPSEDFFAMLHGLLSARVHEVRRLTPTIVEVVIQAPMAAKRFQPGQFYRLQNFEAYALKNRDARGGDQSLGTHSTPATSFAMEGLAMTGAWVDEARGLISVIALEMGGSSNICAWLKPGEPLVLMGPAGTPTEIPQNETVLLVGGGLGNAVLFSIGKAMRANGCRVLYFAGYRSIQDRYKTEEIEAAADQVIWCCDEAPGFEPARAQDSSFTGNIVQALEAYGNNEKGISLGDVDRIIAIGSDRMMQAVAKARHTGLKPFLKPEHIAIGSINSPMQCMMKEICAQCLQLHIDPETGEESYVYSCFNQDQCLDIVSFSHLQQRLQQNSLPEKLTAKWLASQIPGNS